jgi:hypothetical protein
VALCLRNSETGGARLRQSGMTLVLEQSHPVHLGCCCHRDKHHFLDLYLNAMLVWVVLC